jgi:hypothetical protein
VRGGEKKWGWREEVEGPRAARALSLSRRHHLFSLSLSLFLSHVEVDVEGVPAREQAAQDERVVVGDLAG